MRGPITEQHLPNYNGQMSVQLQPYPSHPHMSNSLFSQAYSQPLTLSIDQLKEALQNEREKSEYFEN